MKVRLDKLLANAGLGSRKEVSEKIKEGRVQVNGEIINLPKTKVEENAHLLIDGGKVRTDPYVYYLMNKPTGVISASRDREKTVIDLIRKEDQRKGLFPAGRLDKDTSGLLLITNDGRLSHRLLSPGRHVKKVYIADLDQPIEEADLVSFREGIILKPEGILTQPAKLEILSDTCGRVTISEGKYHQIKRMFANCGKYVLKLKRIQFADLKLPEALAPGDYRPLSPEEIEDLQRSVGSERQENRIREEE